MKNVLKAMLILVVSIAVFMGIDIEVKAQANVTYYDTVKEAGAALREGMTERKATIKLGYTTRKKIDNSIMDEFIEEALKHTGVPTEGDYLRGHYSSYKATAEGSVKSGVYNWIFTYKIKYKTTAAQEEATDKAVAKILSRLNLEGKDTYTKIRKIHDYLCKNVKYDYKNNDNNKLKHTAYAAAVKGTSVCDGYTLLLYRLLLENGIDVREIRGRGNGDSHSWNIVKIDSKYYYIDATWDTTYGSDDWFLKGSKDFTKHTLNKEYKTDAFKKSYPIAASEYHYDGVHDHEYVSEVTKATFSKAGKMEKKCAICGKVAESQTIAKVSSAKLSATLYTYNGKQKTPSVTVKDNNGNVLVKNTDYIVSYAKGRKNVGQYSVKITLKGQYSGNKTLTFKIRPQATKVSSLQGGSKNLTVKYSKCTTQTSGYQIQYATSSTFGSAKSVFVKDNTTVSKKITGLKAKKTYYVRVRTYKTVKIDGKSVKIYSAWSDKKSVKTKA